MRVPSSLFGFIPGEKSQTHEGYVRPDVVLFQEDINPDVDKALRSSDYENADAVVVMGTSLSVDPMMYVPDEFPSNIPKILINQEYVQMAAEYGKPQDWTAFTLGESDAIVTKLKERMME